MTPIPPDELRVRGSRTLATPAAPGGTTGSFQFLIDGPDARPGQEVCLLLSLHDSSFDRCCAIPSCFTLPDCSIDLDDPHWSFQPYDSTLLDFDRGELVLSGFGGGVGGIDVEIPGADLFQAVWAPIDPVDGRGAEIRTASFGPEGLELASAEARELGGTVEIRASFLQRSRHVEVDLLDADGAVVASRTVSSHEPVVSLDRWPTGFIMKDDLSGIIIVGHEDTYATLPGGAARRGSAVRVRPVDRSPRPSFASVALRVAGLDELRLRALAAAVDCDGDGVPDDEAVERDPSLDLDGDGVPDSCRDDDGSGHPGKPAPDVRQGSAG